MDDEEELGGPVPMPITGELDLHTFRPQDVKEVVPAYLEACREKGILVVRIVHGKGIGNLRRTVQAILSRHPDVLSFSQASEWLGSWGATMVRLKAKPERFS
jgi:DNA-nicking Smr family endonuclease